MRNEKPHSLSDVPRNETVTRVLLAEDEPHIVESLSFVLTRAGCVVSAALDGEDALLRLRSDPPDIVILDLMLPRRNGFEVLRAIKSDATTRAIPVIVLTAKGQAQDRRLAREIGADAFMTKPFANRDILDEVRRLVPA